MTSRSDLPPIPGGVINSAILGQEDGVAERPDETVDTQPPPGTEELVGIPQNSL